MTLARNVASGFGQYGMRLVIEGLSREFVTDSTMEAASTHGRTRVVGLVGDSISIKESVDIARAKVDVGGQSIRIVDVAGKATLEFGKRPSNTWWLNANVTDSGTTLTLVDTTGISNGDIIHIDTECILVGTVASSTSLTGCTRGYRSTSGQAHYTQDGAKLSRPMVSDVPQTLDGRRAWIYFYGQGDSPTGPGTLRWIGRVSSAPRIGGDMTSWEFSLDPVTAILNQDLGSNLADPVGPRGIYYPWDSPITIWIQEASGATLTSSPSVDQKIRLPLSSGGFFETQSEFCAALNAQITLGGSWKATSIKAVATDDRSWRIEVQIAGAGNERYVRIGVMDWTTGVHTAVPLQTAAGAEVATVVADTTYYVVVPGPVPRGAFGANLHSRADVDSTLSATWPNTRIYLGGVADPTAATAIRADWGGDIREYVHTITASDATSRWAEVREMYRAGSFWSPFIPYSADATLPSFALDRLFATGTVADFLDALVALSTTYANSGAAPDIRYTASTTDDIALGAAPGVPGTVHRAATECATDPVQKNRTYYYAAKKKLADILAAEAQLLGCFLCLDYYGRITMRKIEPAIPGAVSSGTIDASTLIVSGGFGELAQEVYGTLNTVTIRTGYAAREDKYLGTTFTIRDVSSFGINKAVRAIDIKPVSTATADYESAGVAGPTLTRIASTLLSIFGGPYSTITVEVAMTLFDVKCGDVVTFSHAQMPNTNGTRGIVSEPALVVGREWSPRESKGTLTLMLSQSNFAGYTPTMRVTAASPAGAQTNLTLTVAATTVVGTTRYIPEDTDATTWFQTGDQILLREWDATAPTTRIGTVTSSTATTVVVSLTSAIDLDAALTGGAVYMLGWGDATVAVTRQQSYGYMAESSMTINFATDAPAQVFA